MNCKAGNSMMMSFYKTFLSIFIILISINSITSTSASDAALNDLYENLLQREYAGPISFPDHQVERKAQRSPSLRLRFGRSDPDMMPSAEKRWFGDVNQKPIRSPSLRLRFGRRSDPMMLAEESDGFMDYPDMRFERQLRKPSGRLRWGRSIPFEAEDNDENNEQSRIEQATFGTESLRALLNALRELDENDVAAARAEYTREIRKPAPLRLRWGRSTGKAPNMDDLKPLASSQSLNSNTDSTSATIKG